MVGRAIVSFTLIARWCWGFSSCQMIIKNMKLFKNLTVVYVKKFVDMSSSDEATPKADQPETNITSKNMILHTTTAVRREKQPVNDCYER